MSLERNVDELLGTAPTVVTPRPRTAVVEFDDKVDDATLDRQYAEGEENLRGVLETGKRAVDRMYEIADSDERARSFEVVARLMESTTKVQQDLLELGERRRSLRREKTETEEDEAATTINNTLVLSGTTAEILESLQAVRQNKDLRG